MTGAVIARSFVRLGDGLVHYRSAGLPDAPPMILAHGGPGSSAGMVPLMAALAAHRRVIAPDMMGMGESDPPPSREPTVAAYAADLVQVMDALEIDRADLYGDHTGAQVVCEVALAHPGRVAHLILDGVALFPEDLRAELAERYAPPITPDAGGGHLAHVWTFIDQLTQHFPWYRLDEAHRIGGGRAGDPGVVTDRVAEVLKVWRTAHLTYRAAFNHPLAQRLTQLSVPTTVLAVEGDPLAIYAEPAANLIPRANCVKTSRAQRGATLLATLQASTTP